jgi:hypothetical protein
MSSKTNDAEPIRYQADIRILDAPAFCQGWPVTPLFTILQFRDISLTELAQLIALVVHVDESADVDLSVESDHGNVPVFKGPASGCLSAVSAQRSVSSRSAWRRLTRRVMKPRETLPAS